VPDSVPSVPPDRLPLASTLTGYDRWAPDYDATPNPMVAATAWALRTRPCAVVAADIVELGCGTGRHAPLMLAAGARSFTGIDGSSGMLAVARARAGAAAATFVRGELHATPFAATAFDLALVVLVLEHLRDLEPLAREVARILRPGGRLRLVEIHPDLLANGTGAHFKDGFGEVHFTSVPHTTAAIEQALAAAGFAIAERHEPTAAGALLDEVPHLKKHAGRRVLLDLTAHRPG
jgi:SAM-dependent methyltransferase